MTRKAIAPDITGAVARVGLQDAGWQHTVVRKSRHGRIIVMDSMGYVDQRCDVADVLICGSHTAVCAAALAARARPRGIIGHDSGMGKDRSGIGGLSYWQRLRIAGATVAADSARIGDGGSLWATGRVSAVNSCARQMGVRIGMSVQEAAVLMLRSPTPMPRTRHLQRILRSTPEGKIVGIDTIIYCDARMRDSVMIMAGHTGVAFARYYFALPFQMRGVINGDARDSREASGSNGVAEFDRRGVPIALYNANTARIGDCRDVWTSGIVSSVGQVAAALQIQPGMSVQEAAQRMLQSHDRSR